MLCNFRSTESYCAKKPDKSKRTCVESVAYNRMDPFVVGTNAALDVRAPSAAFKVDTRGWACPCGHRRRYPRMPVGITVAFKTNAFATDGMPHELFEMFTSVTPIIAGAEPELRVSSTRQGVAV